MARTKRTAANPPAARRRFRRQFMAVSSPLYMKSATNCRRLKPICLQIDVEPKFADLQRCKSGNGQLSVDKLKEMSGSNVFADGKAKSRGYFGGVRKPLRGESSIS